MSTENGNDKKTESGGHPPSGIGCGGWLGLLILILAAAAVIFYFVVRPKLEERGVDVGGKLEEAGEEARTLGRRTVDAVHDKYREMRDGVPALLDQAKEQAENARDSVRAGAAEAVDKMREKTGQISRAAKEKAEKGVETVKDKAEKGLDAVEAWY